MWYNGYRLVGLFCMGLSIASKAGVANATLQTYTGIGIKDLHPTFGTVADVATFYAEPAREVINEATNQYWLNGVKQQETYNLVDQEITEQDSYLSNDSDYILIKKW